MYLNAYILYIIILKWMNNFFTLLELQIAHDGGVNQWEMEMK